MLLNVSQSIPQPEPHASAYLIITTPASMQLPCDASTDDLAKSALVRRMNVFVHAWLDVELATFLLGFDLLEAPLNSSKLIRCEDANLRIAPSVSNTPTNILCINGTIKVYRLVVGYHQWV